MSKAWLWGLVAEESDDTEVPAPSVCGITPDPESACTRQYLRLRAEATPFCRLMLTERPLRART